MGFDYRSLGTYLRQLYVLEHTDIYRIAGFGITQGLVSLIIPVTVGNLINAVSFGNLLQPVVVLTLVLAVFLITGSAARLLQVWFIESLQRRLLVRAANAASLAVTRQQARKQDGNANYFIEIFNLQKSLVALLTDGSAAFIALIIGMIVIPIYHPYFFLVDLVLLVAGGYVAGYLFSRKALPLSFAESDSKYRILAKLQEYMGDTGRRKQPAAISDISSEYLENRSRFFVVLFKQQLLLIVLHVLGHALVLLLGGYLVIKKEMSLGQLVAAELILSKLLDSLSKFGKYFQNFFDTSDSLLKLGKISANPGAPGEPHLDQHEKYLASRWHQLRFRNYFGAFAAALLVLLFLPWQQTSFGEGRVVAFSPTERQQTVEAPISGRIAHWHVHEGSIVRKGDKLVTISDLDPQITERLEQERQALSDRVRAAQGRVDSIESRVTSLQLARSEAVNAAESRAAMAAERVRQAQQALAAAEASLDTAKINYDRQKSLFAQGLTSQRNVELAELELKRTQTEEQRAVAGLKAAEQEKTALKRDARRVARDADASINDARATMQGARSELARSNEDLPRIELRLSRQKSQEVVAPKDGIVTRLLVAQEAEYVREGKGLCILIPQTGRRAVELWIDGNDVPLIRDGRQARIIFQGWPALQISGWPQGSFGTFPARVKFIDNADDGHGKFRVVLVPDEAEADHWPDSALLKQGVRAHGWIFLNKVTIGYEIWRKFNDFPPAIPKDENSVNGKK